MLHKNPHILQPSPMLELGERIIAGVFVGQQTREPGARTAFIRMQHMDLLLAERLKEVVIVEEEGR